MCKFKFHVLTTVHTWFLEISFVWKIDVFVYVCVSTPWINNNYLVVWCGMI